MSSFEGEARHYKVRLFSFNQFKGAARIIDLPAFLQLTLAPNQLRQSFPYNWLVIDD